ncbi:MAG: hypothetical protein ABFQ64_01600 [Campylobacterota bacterium]
MYSIEIELDESIYENVMGLLEILPEDRVKVISKKQNPGISFAEPRGDKDNTSSIENQINKILKEEKLLHFKFFKDPNRVLNTHGVGNATNVQDFNRLKSVLKKEGIKFNDIGVDVIMIEED